jgi:hypothetical protein
MPVKGLFLTFRIDVGYAPITLFPSGHAATGHFGVLDPEIGLRYIIGKKWNVGGQLFSLPVFFSPGAVSVQYRLLLYFGLNL